MIELKCGDFRRWCLTHTIDREMVIYRFRFLNGYGASIVRGKFTYGGNIGLWELAVLKFKKHPDEEQFEICYDTEITNDIIGWLSDEQVVELLERIKNL